MLSFANPPPTWVSFWSRGHAIANSLPVFEHIIKVLHILYSVRKRHHGGKIGVYSMEDPDVPPSLYGSIALFWKTTPVQATIQGFNQQTPNFKSQLMCLTNLLSLST